jgi:nitroreductase
MGTLEELLTKRNSVRKFQPTSISKEDLDKLLWAGYGETPIGRTVPSAGACYPLKLYLVEKRADFNFYDALNYIVIAADYSRILPRYGKRGYMYTHIEVGHVAQNITLMAIELGLATVMIGAFRSNKIKQILGIKEEPLYIIPVGKETNGI